MADATSPCLPAALMADPALPPSAKLAWLGLALSLPQAGTVRSVASATGMTFGQAQRALVLLKGAGWLRDRLPVTVRVDPPMDQTDPPVDQDDPPMDQSDPPVDQKRARPRSSTVLPAEVITASGETLVQSTSPVVVQTTPPNPPIRAAKTQTVKPYAIPADWFPSDETRLFAAEHCPAVDLEREVRKFRDYWLEKNSRRPGWDRSFRSWLENAQQWAAERPRAAAPGGARAASPGPTTASGQRLMDLLEKERRHA